MERENPQPKSPISSLLRFEGTFREDSDSVVCRVPSHPKRAFGLRPKMPFRMVFAEDGQSFTVFFNPNGNQEQQSHATSKAGG